MQMPKFTKVATDGRPAYRFELGDKLYEAYRYASGAGAWNVDAIEGDKRRTVVTGRASRAAAVTDAANAERETRLDQLAEDVAQMKTDADELLVDMRTAGADLDELQREVTEWGARVDELTEPSTGEPAVFFVEIDRHVQARPRVYEDRYRIHQRGLADPVEGFAVPYRGDRNDRTTLAFRGWQIVGEVDYVAGLNVSRARVERTPVEYGNSGHWISAHVVDPDAGRPDEHRYVARAKCGDYLIETTDTPRGHALCMACTGDPVEVNYLRDREGWLKDGGRPVKVLRALSYHDRIIASTVTTDAKGSEREWHDVRVDATAPEVIFAAETPATREEIAPGALVEAVVISNRPTVQQWRVDRQPWGDDRSTILSNGRGVDAVYTASLRILEQPEPVNVIDRVDAAVRATAGVSGPGESPVEPVLGVTEPAPGPKCRHGFALRPGVVSTLTCEPGKRYGVFGDEGMIDGSDCAVQAANDAAFHTAEDDGDTEYRVRVVCPDHDEQPADACEECNAEPDE